MAKTVSKDMLICDILDLDINIAPILMQAGMGCIGCPSAQMESIEMACMVHGIDSDKLISDINEYLAVKDV